MQSDRTGSTQRAYNDNDIDICIDSKIQPITCYKCNRVFYVGSGLAICPNCQDVVFVMERKET